MVGIIISAALLWWVLHDISFGEVWHIIRRTKPLPLMLAVAVATVTFPLRAERWRYLLRLNGQEIPFAPLWHATAIGFMANNVLPARAGELARAYAADRLTGVRFSTAVASIAVERVMDGLAMVALLLIGIAFGGFDPGTKIGGFTLTGIASWMGLAFGALLVVSVVVVHWPGPPLAASRWLATHLLPESLARRAVSLVEGLLSGMEALRSPVRFAKIAAWSMVIWCTYAVSYIVCFRAFDMDVSWTAGFMLQALIAFGIAIPSSPGFFGPFEAVTRATLALYGVGPDLAVSFAIVYHIASFLPITLMGFWSLSRAHLHLADLRQAAPSTESAPED